jgi:predicted MFS family arabinose efflux permease
MSTPTPSSRQSHLLAVLAASLIGAICNLVVNTLPAYLAVVARAQGFSEADMGWCAMADVSGLAIGTTACALLPGLVLRLNWRRTVWLGAGVMLLGNLLSMHTSGLGALLAVRVLAGLGSGIAMAVVYASFADGDSAREMSLFNAGQLGLGAAAIPLLSSVAAAHGVSGMYAALAGTAVVALALAALLPLHPKHHAPAHAHHAAPNTKVSLPGWLAVGSVFCFFMSVGAMYSYLGYMGAAWGLTEAQVESDLSVMLFVSMGAALLVVAMGLRFGLLGPLLVAFGGLLASITLFVLLKPSAGFLACGTLFGFCMNFIMPLHFAAVTRVDTSSSAAMLVGSATLAGFAVGPGIAGNLVTPDFTLVNAFGLGTCGLSLVLVLWALHLHGRKAHQQAVPEQPALSTQPEAAAA